MEKLNLEDYIVTERGSVYSPNKKLALGVGSHGYLTFVAGLDGTQLVHREVARRYLPNPENKRTVNHKDGNKHNNHVENLEWATDAENNQHAIDYLGRKPSRGRMKISDEDAAFIYNLKGLVKQVDLAQAFNVPRSTIGAIHSGKRKIEEWEARK